MSWQNCAKSSGEPSFGSLFLPFPDSLCLIFQELYNLPELELLYCLKRIHRHESNAKKKSFELSKDIKPHICAARRVGTLCKQPAVTAEMKDKLIEGLYDTVLPLRAEDSFVVDDVVTYLCETENQNTELVAQSAATTSPQPAAGSTTPNAEARPTRPVRKRAVQEIAPSESLPSQSRRKRSRRSPTTYSLKKVRDSTVDSSVDILDDVKKRFHVTRSPPLDLWSSFESGNLQHLQSKVSLLIFSPPLRGFAHVLLQKAFFDAFITITSTLLVSHGSVVVFGQQEDLSQISNMICQSNGTVRTDGTTIKVFIFAETLRKFNYVSGVL